MSKKKPNIDLSSHLEDFASTQEPELIGFKAMMEKHGCETFLLKSENLYTESQLVSFGNFLLSEERQKNVSEEARRYVTEADLANFKQALKQ